ncbi:MAG: hypothetical protein ACFUZC_02315 [Chthoniobacteraceae bacterium]
MKNNNSMVIDLTHSLRDFILNNPDRKARLETIRSIEIVLEEGRVREGSKSVDIEEKILAHSMR